MNTQFVKVRNNCNLSDVAWRILSDNSHVIDILDIVGGEANRDYILYDEDVVMFSDEELDILSSSTQGIFPYEDEDQDMDDIENIASLEAAMHILADPESVDIQVWDGIWNYPELFTYDYNKIKSYYEKINMEIIEEVYKPARIQKFLENGNELEMYLL